MSWESLKSAVTAVITANGNGEITGQILQDLINDNLIPQLGEIQYKGIAIPSSTPGTPESNVFYIADSDGTYPNFNGLILDKETALIVYDTVTGWRKDTIVDYKKSVFGTIAEDSDGAVKGSELFNSLKNKANLVPGKNMFNKISVLDGKYPSPTTGEVLSSAAFSLSEFTAVLENTIYTIRFPFIIVAYDASGNYLAEIPQTGGTFTTPVGTSYIRYGMYTTNLSAQQMELGNSFTSYEAFKLSLKADELPMIENVNLAGGITSDKVAFKYLPGLASKNLFDKEAITAEHYVTAETGQVLPLAGFSASDWMPVLPNTEYTINHGFIIVAFDSGKIYIDSVTAVNGTFTTSATTLYIRVTTKNLYLSAQQMELGSVSTTYETFDAKVARESVLNIDNRYALKLLLPNDIHIISGEMFSLFFDNIVKYYQYYKRGNFYIAIQEKTGATTYAGKGNTYNYKWDYTALNTESTFDMEFRIVSTYDGSIIDSKVVTFYVADSSDVANHGRNATIVSIGDSFLDGYPVIFNTFTNITTKGGINAVNFIGVNDGNGSALVKDDAWAGYTYDWFYDNPRGYLRSLRPLEDAEWDAGWGENETNGWTTGQTWADLSEVQKTHGFTKNQFYNPTTQIFDFSYYMSTYMSNQSVDGFICALGLNDIGWSTVSAVELGLTSLKAKILHIVNSVHIYSAGIKILLYTIPSQKADNNTIGSAFSTFSDYERVNHNISLFNEMLIDGFSNISNVQVLASGANFDSRTGYITAQYNPNKFDPAYTEEWSNDIHPSPEGAKYIADSFYQAIYNLILN